MFCAFPLAIWLVMYYSSLKSNEIESEMQCNRTKKTTAFTSYLFIYLPVFCLYFVFAFTSLSISFPFKFQYYFIIWKLKIRYFPLESRLKLKFSNTTLRLTDRVRVLVYEIGIVELVSSWKLAETEWLKNPKSNNNE